MRTCTTPQVTARGAECGWYLRNEGRDGNHIAHFELEEDASTLLQNVRANLWAYCVPLRGQDRSLTKRGDTTADSVVDISVSTGGGSGESGSRFLVERASSQPQAWHNLDAPKLIPTMRWKDARRSTNVEDRRGSASIRRPAKLGVGALLIVLLLSLLFGQNPLEILGLLGGDPLPASDPSAATSSTDEGAEFVSVVLADMEDVWDQLFSSADAKYVPARLVLFRGAVESACGYNTAAVGPFYCPPDRRVYIDLSFTDELRRMGASGDFALAYVIAHEVGHHVQNLVGTSESVSRLQRQSGQSTANQLSVALELQADCYAGVWAHHSRRRGTISYDGGDFDEGIRTAAVIGDDHLQRQAGRHVRPESFTHGTSEQRMAYLRHGLATGHIAECNTFD